MQLLLPVVRADLEAAETYVFSPAEPRLNVPIVALGGSADPRVNREQIEGWSVHTSAGFHSQYFPGDHFFIHTDRDAVIAAVTAVLQLIDEKH
jgi:medium-chain acyl-[acyl-carrier-protein] hydrolase